MQNTTHYNLKKPDYTDFADVFDINDNMDTIDAELAAPTGDGRDQTVSFTDADLDSGITSFPTFLTKIVSGMKMAKFLRDFKAGMGYVLHTGSLINNATCTESGKALDARMGKTLQDQITSLNDSLVQKQEHQCESDTVTTATTSNKPIYFNGEVLNKTQDVGYFLIIGSLIGENGSGTIWLVRVFASTPMVIKIVENNLSSASLSLFFSTTGNLCIKSSQLAASYHYTVMAI